jgi:hypothetical protein
MSDSKSTADDVAAWMLEQVGKRPLYQDEAAWKIRRRFGKTFIYDNPNGNPAVGKTVLAKFKAISSDDIVWSRGERLWRKRTARDEPGRMQD